MKKVYYEKVGRKYVPVSEYNSDFLDAFGKGVHIVMSYPGGQSRKYNIDPAFGPMIAAGRYAADAMSKAMVAASEARPSRSPLTKEQVAAWNKMQRVMGNEMFGLQYESTYDIIDAGVKAMQLEASKLIADANPAVKEAYDQFIMLCELTRTNDEKQKS